MPGDFYCTYLTNKAFKTKIDGLEWTQDPNIIKNTQPFQLLPSSDYLLFVTMKVLAKFPNLQNGTQYIVINQEGYLHWKEDITTTIFTEAQAASSFLNHHMGLQEILPIYAMTMTKILSRNSVHQRRVLGSPAIHFHCIPPELDL